MLLLALTFDCTLLETAQGSGIRESHYVSASPYEDKSLKVPRALPAGAHALHLPDRSPRTPESQAQMGPSVVLGPVLPLSHVCLLKRNSWGMSRGYD